jgi:ligand-binding sensor domain-containing protein/two-component sensor histidine kinase
MRGSLVIMLMFASTLVCSQQKQFVFKHFTKDDRLASNRVNFVTKDQNGFIWFSTSNGLQHYDGKLMVSFMHDDADSSSLPDNQTGILMEDKHGRMWVTSAQGISIYDPLHFRFIPVRMDFKPPFEVYAPTAMMHDSKGSVWLCMNPGGLFKYDSSHNIFKSYTAAWPKCPANILRIAEDLNTGNYWLGTDSGLMLYDVHRREYLNTRNNPTGLNCFRNPNFGVLNLIMHYREGKLWLTFWGNGERRHSYQYDAQNDHYEEIVSDMGNAFNFFTDASGTTWSYGEKLCWFNKKTKAFIEVQKKRNDRLGIDFNEMYNLYEDDEHNLWASTDMGVFVFNPLMQKFNTATIQSHSKNQEVDGNINGFVQTNDGTIIALGWGVDGLYFYDSVFNRIPNQYGFDPSKIKDPNFLMAWTGLQDSKGIIWIGCQSGHIMKINPVTHQYSFLIPPAFTNRTIRTMLEDRNGDIWFGTHNNVLVKWERSTNLFKQIMPAPTASFVNTITSLLEGDHDDIWVGTGATGLIRLNLADGRILEQFLGDKKNPKGIQTSSVLAICRWKADTVALATNKGIELFGMHSKAFRHITENDGLPSNYIISMARDDQDNLWFTTYNGLWKIHLPDNKIAAYGPKEGVTEATYYMCSAARMKKGTLAFGGIRGFVYFHPEEVRDKSLPPDVRITGFQVFNKYMSVDSLFERDNSIRLDYTQNFINIRFSSMSYLLNDRLDYYYKLEGVDKDWVKASPQREANYTYLPGGTYSFNVKAVSDEGFSSKNITSFSIYIRPPFWQRWWFYLLCVLALGGIIYVIYRIRIDRLLEMEKVRRRIARDLHDDMGSTLSTINILSEMAKMKVENDSSATRSYLNKISDNSSRMMEAMDDIVWSINPMNDSMQKITARMREFAASVLEAKNIEYSFRVDEEVKDIKLNMEERRDFFLIFKEAVNNLAKYSNCRHAHIEVSVHKSKLYMKIQDDGTGFDVNGADNGNGLINMRKRAGSLRGALSIESQNGVGTKIQLEVPVG